MSRPTVPHCKECRYWDSFVYTDRRVTPSRSVSRCKMNLRYMTGQDVRTSPIWCPLRCRGYRVAVR